ncbi:hypothetical protein BBJ28_00023712 [Nothophytophthora sp. Chile5]|nr:hypothetical protein BBJ28_00023712 [Nothophytophthora sp. Chile5]
MTTPSADAEVKLLQEFMAWRAADGEDGPHGTRTLQREAFFEIWATVRELASQNCASFGMEHLDSLVKAVVLREDASTLTLGGSVLLLQAPSEMRAGTAPTDDDFAVPVMAVSRGDQSVMTGALLGKRSRSASSSETPPQANPGDGNIRHSVPAAFAAMTTPAASSAGNVPAKPAAAGISAKSSAKSVPTSSAAKSVLASSVAKNAPASSTVKSTTPRPLVPAFVHQGTPPTGTDQADDEAFRATEDASNGDAAEEEEEEEEEEVEEDDEDDEADDLPPSPPKKPAVAKSYPPSKKRPAQRKKS